MSSDHLSKIWSIDTETAKRTINITMQLLKHVGERSLESVFFDERSHVEIQMY